MSNKHDVMFDRVGWGNYPRLTCLSCNVTCLKKAYMNTIQWLEAVREFDNSHPSKKGKEIIEKTESIKNLLYGNSNE